MYPNSHIIEIPDNLPTHIIVYVDINDNLLICSTDNPGAIRDSTKVSKVLSEIAIPLEHRAAHAFACLLATQSEAAGNVSKTDDAPPRSFGKIHQTILDAYKAYLESNVSE